MIKVPKKIKRGSRILNFVKGYTEYALYESEKGIKECFLAQDLVAKKPNEKIGGLYERKEYETTAIIS